ncbi:unnamed protein product [Protopolystoma xenopodis]|uniref:Secreted protein n=1 Tax=Protopolystoma xenopodis TaxID=117903 RepID=A0A448X133_9PLAT|nr:unnamed protein product [Protopolystoma xenopodis]
MTTQDAVIATPFLLLLQLVYGKPPYLRTTVNTGVLQQTMVVKAPTACCSLHSACQITGSRPHFTASRSICWKNLSRRPFTV